MPCYIRPFITIPCPTGFDSPSNTQSPARLGVQRWGYISYLAQPHLTSLCEILRMQTSNLSLRLGRPSPPSHHRTRHAPGWFRGNDRVSVNSGAAPSPRASDELGGKRGRAHLLSPRPTGHGSSALFLESHCRIWDRKAKEAV